MPSRSTVIGATLAGVVAIGLAMAPAAANAAQVQACANVQAPTPATKPWYDYNHTVNPIASLAADVDTAVAQVAATATGLNPSSSDTAISAAQNTVSFVGGQLDSSEDAAESAAEVAIDRLFAGVTATGGDINAAADAVSAASPAISNSATAYDNAVSAWTDAVGNQLDHPMAATFVLPDSSALRTAAVNFSNGLTTFFQTGANKVVLQTVNQCAVVTVPDVAVQSTTTSYGKAASVNATVALSGVPQSGNLVALIDGKPLTAPQINGTTTLALPADLSVGTHYVTVAYSAPGNAGPSTAFGTVVVTKAATSTTVKLSKSSVKKGKSAKATVTVAAPGLALAPTGSVTLYVNGKKFATKTLKAGKATVALKTSKKGTQKVTVKYATSVNFAASSSKSTSLKIK